VDAQQSEYAPPKAYPENQAPTKSFAIRSHLARRPHAVPDPAAESLSRLPCLRLSWAIRWADVCFAPKSDRRADIPDPPRSARSRSLGVLLGLKSRDRMPMIRNMPGVRSNNIQRPIVSIWVYNAISKEPECVWSGNTCRFCRDSMTLLHENFDNSSHSRRALERNLKRLFVCPVCGWWKAEARQEIDDWVHLRGHYSLDLVASRPAKVGDELVTTKFKNSITRGFAAIGEPNVAVCLLPGTEVAFEREVKSVRIRFL
jgi:hypothetical protein